MYISKPEVNSILADLLAKGLIVLCPDGSYGATEAGQAVHLENELRAMKVSRVKH